MIRAFSFKRELNNSHSWQKRRGFTLVEMSLVLIVIGLVIVIIFPALKAVRDGNAQSATTSHLQTLLRASAAFTQAHGCLPCPTPAATTGIGFGHVRGLANASLCGTCSQAEGIAPFADLGLPSMTAKDGWGRWITMRVDPALTVNFAVIPPTSACLAGDPAPCTLGASQKGLCRSGLSTTNRISIGTPQSTTQQAAILLLSHGPNGYGAYKTSLTFGMGSNTHSYNGPAGSCTNNSGFEQCNTDGDKAFIDTPATFNKTDPFDDQMLYLSRNALVSYLGQGSCQTEW